MSVFGDNLRRIRKERQLSMDALAEKIGTTKQVISRYEKGMRMPKLSMAQQIAQALNVSLYDLMPVQDDSEARPGEKLSIHMQQTGDTVEDVAAALRVTPEDVERMISGDLSITPDQAGILADRYEVNFTDFVDEDADLDDVREEFRRNPELRSLFSLQRNCTRDELKQMEAFIRAIRSTYRDD